MAGQAPPKMGRELQCAIAEDALAKARNDAKLRAVAQRVDYETFKNMVSVAHLRPLQAPNTRADGRRAPAWGFDADGVAAAADASAAAAAGAFGDGGAASSSDAPQAPPASGIEFERAWRAAASPGRVALLRRVPADAFPALFKVEVSHALLGELLATLRHEWRDLAEAGGGDGAAAHAPAAAVAAGVLRGVAGAGRFALTSRLLGAVAREHAASLFAELEAALRAAGDGAAEELEPLRRAYAAT